MTLLAIKAATFGTCKSFGSDLLELSHEEIYREQCHIALSKYQNNTVRFLRQRIQDSTDRYIVQYPYILSRIGTQQSIDFLFELINHRILRLRRAALISLNTLRNEFPHLDFKNRVINKKLNSEAKILRRLVVVYTRIRREIDSSVRPEEGKALRSLSISIIHEINRSVLRLFIYLGLRLKKDNVATIYHGIKSHHQEIKSDALDFLDDLLDYDMKTRILPILELVINRQYTREDLTRTSLTMPSMYEALKILSKAHDEVILNKVSRYAVVSENLRFGEFIRHSEIRRSKSRSKQDMREKVPG